MDRNELKQCIDSIEECADKAKHALQSGHVAVAGGCPQKTEFVDEQRLWAQKCDQQNRDLDNLSAGRATEDQMSWFSGGRARSCRLINSPY